jgi:hypothetical protein
MLSDKTSVIPAHDCMEKVRPGTGRETGLGYAGGRATQEQVRPGTGRETGLGHAKAEAGPISLATKGGQQ